MSWGLVSEMAQRYNSVDELPAWMQRKLATLMIFDHNEVNNEIEGLGRRISENTFWIYPTGGESNGDDP
jgi:hypothetical protein